MNKTISPFNEGVEAGRNAERKRWLDAIDVSHSLIDRIVEDNYTRNRMRHVLDNLKARMTGAEV